MKQFKLNYILCALALTALLSSCRKDNDNTTEDQDITASRKGIFILSEGLWGFNNSSLTYYDYAAKTTIADQFFTANDRGLGDTGNDVQVYGSKMYIVVNVSNTVEVVDAKTAKSVKKIEFKNGEVGRQPRYVVFDKNKAYVSTFDGNVAVVDTASLTVDKYIKVGSSPEKMAIANGKLYVANSGGLDYPDYANTVSVIDIATGTETKKITVGLNPGNVFADKYGDIYVLSNGDYGATLPSMSIISSATDLVTKTFDNFSASGVSISADFAYMLNYDGTVRIFNLSSETIVQANFITDGTVITSPYGINVDTVTGEVFITDAKDYTSNGEVFCFDSFGRKKYSLTTGINPNTVVFINN